MTNPLPHYQIMTKFALFVAAIVFSFSSSYAGEPEDDIILGKRISIHSEVLNEEREMMIYLPPGYNQADASYPVLYLLDGQAHFLHASGITQYLSRLGVMPQMIVVAINNIDRTRDFSPTHIDSRPNTGGAPKFLSFLDKELIPYIDENYKTAPFRILMGHSFGGTFAVYSLYTNPELFSGYIAVSPYLHYDDNYLVNQAETKLKSAYNKPKFFFMTVGNEPNYFEPLKTFSTAMKEISDKSIKFQYNLLMDENHGSIPHLSIYKGLSFIYADWSLPQYKIGEGLDKVDAHFEHVSLSYGFEVKTPENFVNLIGYRHLQNNETDKAIEVFKENVKRYPKSANVYDSLGEAYETSKQIDLAAKNYKKAYELGKQMNDPNTQVYLTNLKRIQK